MYREGRRRRAGPLVVGARPNGMDHCRLGLAVPRRVGGAVVRNRIKRLLREAFRHLQHDLPRGYDLVVNVGRHEPLLLADYLRLLAHAMRRLDREWSEARQDRGPKPGAGPASRTGG